MSDIDDIGEVEHLTSGLYDERPAKPMPKSYKETLKQMNIEIMAENMEQRLNQHEEQVERQAELDAAYAEDSDWDDEDAEAAQREYRSAYSDFKRVKDAQVENIEGDAVEIAEIEKWKGNRLFQKGKHRPAYEAYQRGINAFEDLVKEKVTLSQEGRKLLVALYCNAAAVLLMCEDADGDSADMARVSASKALEFEPNNIKAMFRRGCAHSRAEDWNLARDDFERALRLEPENAQVQKELQKIKDKLSEDRRAAIEAELKDVAEVEEAEGRRLLQEGGSLAAFEAYKRGLDLLDEAIDPARMGAEVRELGVALFAGAAQALLRHAYISNDEAKADEVIPKTHATRVAQNAALYVGASWGSSGTLPKVSDTEEHKLPTFAPSTMPMLWAARELADKALELEPAHTDALLARGRAHVLERNWDRARDDLQEVLQEDSSNDVARALLQRTLRQKREQPRQDELTTATSSSSGSFQTILDKAMEVGYMKKADGNALFKRKRFHAAVDAYKRGLDSFQDIQPMLLSVKARKLVVSLYSNSAQALLRTYGIVEKCVGARVMAEKALELDPTNVKALFRRGCAYANAEDWEGAQEDFQEVLRLEPTNDQAKAELHKMKANIKAPPKPQTDTRPRWTDLDSMLKVEDVDLDEILENAEYEKIEGDRCSKKRKYQAAFEAYKRGIDAFEPITLNKLTPRARKLKCSLYCRGSRAALGCGDVLGAEWMATKAVVLERSSTKALFWRGCVYARRDRWELACEDFQRLVRIDPTNGAARSQLQKAEERIQQEQQQSTPG